MVSIPPFFSALIWEGGKVGREGQYNSKGRLTLHNKMLVTYHLKENILLFKTGRMRYVGATGKHITSLGNSSLLIVTVGLTNAIFKTKPFIIFIFLVQ